MKNPPKVGWRSHSGGYEVEVHSIYELIDVIRQKPGIYIGEPSVTGLFHFLIGFDLALHASGNPFDTEEPPFRGFNDWIASRLGFRESTSGWCRMLLAATGNERAAFDHFLDELDAYRRPAARS